MANGSDWYTAYDWTLDPTWYGSYYPDLSAYYFENVVPSSDIGYENWLTSHWARYGLPEHRYPSLEAYQYATEGTIPSWAQQPASQPTPPDYVGSFLGNTGETAFLGSSGQLYRPSGEQYGWMLGNTLVDMQGNILGNIDLSTGTYTTTDWGEGTYQSFTDSGFDIPTDVYPASSSVSESSDISSSLSAGYSGLSDELRQILSGYLDTMSPIYGQYMDVLDMLKSPGAFADAYRPIQESVNKLLLANLANRGIISSSTADKAFAEAAKAVPSAYLNQLLNIAGVYDQAAAIPLTALGLGAETYDTALGESAGSSISSGWTSDPLAPYQLLADILLST